MTATPSQRSGFVAIVGRPNVGKSTLLNHILGQKISITSRKPQTTRHRILGVKTEGATQVVYVDTPGIHRQKRKEKAINRYMNRAATGAIGDVDVIVFVVDQLSWTPEDSIVAEEVGKARCPVLLVINKVDKVADKATLLPHIDKLNRDLQPEEIIPVSALNGHNLDSLERAIAERLPEGPLYFPEDQVTDRTERFLAAEIVREKIMRQLGDEIPYSMTVEIEQYKETEDTAHISALILVEREGQKKIVIGGGGSRLRLIGEEARKDIERLIDRKVMLRLWVKVKSGWSDDERALRSLGYSDFE